VIYLASQSPRRQEILKSMELIFCVVKSSYQEKKIRGAGPRKLTVVHAVGKVQQAQVTPGARFILGADTVVVFGKKIFTKPKNKKQAFKMLSQLSGKWHSVFTGVALLDRQTNKIRKACVCTKVLFRELSSTQILKYMKRVNPLDKAGGYAIQKKPRIVEKISGSYTNVVGLPVETFREMLKEAFKR